MGHNVFSSNRIDQEIVQLIYKDIEAYEKDNHIEIRKIAVAKDANPMYGYYGTVDYIGFDTNVRALVVDWAVVPAINFYSNRDFTNVRMPADVYNTYIAGNDWSWFDPDEQLVFIGDTLYLVSY